jgi:uncharacterized protein (TIGR02569 family)
MVVPVAYSRCATIRSMTHHAEHDGQTVLLDESVARAFDVDRPVVRLPGGEGRTYRAGDVVLRRETDDAAAGWTADLFAGIEETGFRVARPIRTRQGGWLAAGEWSAWTFLEGRPATRDDLAQVVPAIDAFHAALAGAPRIASLRASDNPFGRADLGAWDGPPTVSHPRIAALLARLAAVRRPIHDTRDQVIHGDLNPGNILVAPGLAPAIIDIAPYWRPAGFAAAVAAFWFGPYNADPSALAHFAHIPHFDQFLVRAATRMLLAKTEFGTFDDLDRYDPAVAIVADYVHRSHPRHTLP